jgi:hypothetical protein
MTEPTGGRSGRLDDDEFEEAFARLTAPVVTVTVQDSTGRSGESAPGTQAPTPSTPGMRATDEPPPKAPESVVTEAPTQTPPRPDHDVPAHDERPSQIAEGAKGMQKALGAFRPSTSRASPRPTAAGLRFPFSAPQASSDPPPPNEPSTDCEHSPYYRSFVRNVTLRRQAISSGYERLDGLLGGGFHLGLSLLSGHRRGMRRAFLDSLVWGAVVEQKCPIWYYALDTGTQAVWERMIVTLGSLFGEPVLPEELHASRGDDDIADRVGRIDAALVRNVLPHVRLRDPVGVDCANSRRFMARLDARLLHEDRPCLLIIDSLFRLFPPLGEEHAQRIRFAGELDRLLRSRSSAAVATVSVAPDQQLLDVVRGHLRLAEFEGSKDGSKDATSETVVVTAHDEGRVTSALFAVDVVTGLFG